MRDPFQCGAACHMPFLGPAHTQESTLALLYGSVRALLGARLQKLMLHNTCCSGTVCTPTWEWRARTTLTDALQLRLQRHRLHSYNGSGVHARLRCPLASPADVAPGGVASAGILRGHRARRRRAPGIARRAPKGVAPRHLRRASHPKASGPRHRQASRPPASSAGVAPEGVAPAGVAPIAATACANGTLWRPCATPCALACTGGTFQRRCTPACSRSLVVT